MEVACATCGNDFVARRSTARYCSDRCRVRAHRAQGKKLPDVVKPAVQQATKKTPPASGEIGEPLSVEDAVRAELERAERTGTFLGQAALVLARRLDVPSMDTGSAVSSLVKQLSATLELALAGVAKEEDPVDELRARRDRKIRPTG